MNRSLAYVGVGLILFGACLIAFPIAVTGREVLDLEQTVGLLVAPVGLVVVMIAAASFDPERTTVRAAFGGTDEPPEAHPPAAGVAAHLMLTNPKAPVHCRFCRTVITYDLARCPRCARDRPCRACGHALIEVEDRATCPSCSRPELLCNCPPGIPERSRPGLLVAGGRGDHAP